MSLSEKDFPSLQGAENARIILIALFSVTASLVICCTLVSTAGIMQIKYFWTGSWGMSRVLFLVNRYLSPAISLLALVCKSEYFKALRFSVYVWLYRFLPAKPELSTMLVVRVWYLFSQSRTTRIAMIVVFFISNAISLYFAILSAIDLDVTKNLTEFHIYGCRASRPQKFWRLYLPSLVIHTMLYCLTAFRALKNRRVFKDAPLLKRLVRDGGFFYFVVFISILFTSIGSFLRQYPSINIPAIFSNFTVATTSIAASRVMLSIHSLAAKLGSNSAWLLNNIELSRVPWRRGATEGEIIVDRFGRDHDDDDERDSPSASVASLKTSRVGRWDDETW
ncbi:hypothetical protein B0H10DRAFT_2383949 [Mycena sp. CBHHK59/15]|nr:hypothetical protein B0H10DRAFT_2383949 [Mycena sp. CBHHK59/15]